ncbi:MAG: MarR family transcriptional regulator [Pseudomonadota bacterium]
MATIELALLVDRLMRRIHVGLQSRAEEFDPHNVGPWGGMVLLTLSDHDGIEIGALARHLGRDKSQVTRTLASLESKGFINRPVSQTDGRVRHVRLTKEGHAMVETLGKAVAESLDQALGPLASTDLKALEEILERGLSRV